MKKQDRKINLNDIEFDENKLKKLFTARKKRDAIMIIIILTMITNQLVMNVVGVLMRVAMKMKKFSKRKNIKKKTVTKTKAPPIKQKKKQQKGIIDYINS